MPYPLWLTRLLIKAGIARFFPFAQRIGGGSAENLRHYSRRAVAAPYELLEVAQRCSKPSGGEYIDLTIGSPRFDLLPTATCKLTVDQRGFPPPYGVPELCDEVGRRLAEEHGRLLVPWQVLITAGALGGLRAALDAFLDAGDRVVLLDPSAWQYVLMIYQRRGRIIWVPTEMDRGRLRFCLSSLVRGLRHAKLLILNSPSNPSGGVIAEEDLRQIAWWCERHRVLILSDEVYRRFQYDIPAASISATPQGAGRTLVLGSVSMSHALAAYRVGWLAGPSPLLRPCLAAAVFGGEFVPTISQQLAVNALRLPESAFAPIRADFCARRSYLHDRLTGMGLRPDWPAGGFYVWVPIDSFQVSGREFAERLLRDKRVAVMPGELFGPSGRGRIRLSFAAEDGRLREGLNRMAEMLHLLAPPATLVTYSQAA